LKNYTIAARAEPGRKRERETRDWQETAVLGEEKRDKIGTVARVVNCSHASDHDERRRWLEAGSMGCP
jgi:hypothetical protein